MFLGARLRPWPSLAASWQEEGVPSPRPWSTWRNPARPRFTLCLSVKTLPLVSRRDEPNLGEEGQACAWWTGCPEVTDVSLTLENTHLFPSPLGIRWSFPDYGPSPGTKQSVLEMFHGLTVRGGHIHTHTHTRFCLRSCLQWPRKVHTRSQIPALRPVPLCCLCPLPFHGVKEGPSPPSPRWPPIDKDRGS